ncbi:MAG: AmmeMemoRadiSam system protein A [Candidatus Pacearchaeota archaeon]
MDYKPLLKLARNCIECELLNKNFDVPDDIKKKFNEKKACFVTLKINGRLRGCIGSLEAKQELWKDVIDNSRNAAFFDPRFSPLNYDELSKIKIEISILTKPKKLGIGSYVFDKIDKKMGIILKKGYSSATFLPQVWEEIPDKTKFLEHLSLKAGLSPDSWKDAELYYYRVDSCEE